MKHRRLGVCIATGLVLIARVRAQDSTQFMDGPARDLFYYSRMAIGDGGANVAKLHGLILKGRSKFIVEGGLTGAAVEIKLLLPDHYLRIDTSGTVQKMAGYAGKTVLSAIHDGPLVTLPPESLLKTILQNEKHRVARLLLGATTYVGGDVAMTFSSVPRSVEFVDPRVNPRTSISVDNSTAEPLTALVSGERFSAQFMCDGKTRMPAQITYVGADKKPVIIRFEDRRVVDGLHLPFHIITTSDGRIIDELSLDEIFVNPELSKRDFSRSAK